MSIAKNHEFRYIAIIYEIIREESSYNQEECTNKSPQINITNTPLNEMSFMTDSQLDSTIITNKAVLKDGPIISDSHGVGLSELHNTRI